MSTIIRSTDKQWNREYLSGKWNFLEESSLEKARSSVIGMYCGHFFPEGKILDVGCGTGVLLDYLNTVQQGKYAGIDISSEAISLARGKRNFSGYAVDATLFNTAERFDVIVFNEVLYYLPYQQIFEKYNAFLNTDAIIIISVYRKKTFFGRRVMSRILKESSKFFLVYEDIQLTGQNATKKLTWDLKIMKKKEQLFNGAAAIHQE